MLNLFKKINTEKSRGPAMCVLAFVVFICILFFQPKSADAATLSRPSNNLGLVGYWSLNEGTGTAAMDYSGNGNTGTLLSSPTWSNGKLGSALTFNGSNQVTANDSALPAASSTLTVSAWVKTTSTSPTFQSIVRYGGSTSGSQYYIGMYKGTDCTGTITTTGGNYAAVAGAGGAGSNVCDNVTINDGQWHNITSTYDGTNHLLYVDGVLKSSRTQTLAITPGGAGSFHIGGLAGQLLTGSADEVRVYNRALSATQVASLYNVGVQKYTGGVSNNGLVGYWSFNEGTGTVATDYSGNKNTGTLVSMSNPPTSTSGWTTGKLGGALNFDGSVSYVNAGAGTSTANLAATASGTPASWSFWFKASSTSSGTLLARNDGNSVSPGWWIQFNSGQIELVLERSSLNSRYFVSIPGAGVWTHVVFTQSGNAVTPTVNAYVNGVQVTLASTGTGSGVSTSDLAQTLYIGRYGASSGGGAGFFGGSLDEVRIYNRVISSTEAARLYSAGLQKINASRNVTGGSLDQGLVGLWSFDGKDMNGTTTAYDRSGQGNNGTLTNGPVPTIGKIGQALSFDGVNDTATASNYNLSAYSMCFWIKSLVAPSTANTIQPIVNGNADPVWGLSWSHTDPTFKQAFFQELPNSSFVAAQLTSTLQANTWYHVCGTYDGANLKAYLNGVNQATVPVTSVKVPTGTFTFSRVSGGNTPFGGSIDDVRIYNRALSASEVTALYNLGK